MKADGITIRINDLGEFANDLARLGASIPRIMQDSIEDALTNGRSEILADIWHRTPQSDRARYAYRYRSINRKDWKADGSGLKSGWRQKIEGDERISPWTANYRIHRLDEYGQQRLRKSLFGGQDNYGIRGLEVKTARKAASFSLVTNLPYARRMHEATDIIDYWAGPTDRDIGAKRGKGWSTRGTGAKYLSDPVDNKRRIIRADVREALLFRLKEATE